MNLFTEYIGFDIGTHSLKLVSVNPGSGGEGFAMADSIIEELPLGLVSGGFTNPTVTDLGQFRKIVEKVLGRLKSRKEGFIVGLPDRWVKLHLTDLVMKKEELSSKEYIEYRLQKKLLPPNLLTEVITDYQTLGAVEKPDGIECRMLAAMVQRSIIDILSKLFADLHMEIMAFDTSTLGVYNLLEDAHPDKTLDRALIHCHLGHETTVVKVYEKGILVYERVIEVAGEAFGKLLAEAENISFADAQLQKPKRSFFPLTRQELLASIPQRHLFEKVFGNWLRELHVTFRFYQDRNRVMHLPHIYLSGGSSQFAGLPEFLSDFFEAPCHRLNPLSDIPTKTPFKPDLLELGPVLAPALGLLAR